MAVPDAAPIVQLVLRAAAALGHHVASAPMGGGCDANVLNGRGFQVANLGTGMRDIHTVKEWLRMSDMVRTAEVIVEMLRLHATQSTNLPLGERAKRSASADAAPRFSRRRAAGPRSGRQSRAAREEHEPADHAVGDDDQQPQAPVRDGARLVDADLGEEIEVAALAQARCPTG